MGHRPTPLNHRESVHTSRGAAERTRQAGGRYLVHEHGTDSQHFEFQLEISGVLKSWTVIRGPSLDPDVKRLAVRTQDRPADQESLEAPAVADGGRRAMLVWDHGSWTAGGDPKEGLERGRLQFELHGERLHGAFSLVRLGGKAARENWFLIKARDAHVERTEDGKELWDWSAGRGKEARRRGSGGRRGRKPSLRTRIGEAEDRRDGEDPAQV